MLSAPDQACQPSLVMLSITKLVLHVPLVPLAISIQVLVIRLLHAPLEHT